jgi:hypothetical protein
VVACVFGRERGDQRQAKARNQEKAEPTHAPDLTRQFETVNQYLGPVDFLGEIFIRLEESQETRYGVQAYFVKRIKKRLDWNRLIDIC